MLQRSQRPTFCLQRGVYTHLWRWHGSPGWCAEGFGGSLWPCVWSAKCFRGGSEVGKFEVSPLWFITTNGCSTEVTKTNSSLVSANNGHLHQSWWFHFFNQSFFLFYFFFSLSHSLCFCAISGALHVFATLLHVRRHCLGCWHSIKRLAAVVDGVAKHYGSVLQDFPYATRPLKNDWPISCSFLVIEIA